MEIYNIETGEFRASIERGFLKREGIPYANILDDRSSLISGFKGERFTLKKSGALVQLLEDVATPEAVQSLKSRGALIYTGAFVGENE